MGQIVFITGGARSGKSSFAEKLALETGRNITYIATLNIFDEEMKSRVEEHKNRRDSRFQTVEAYKNFDVIFKNIPANDTILFDCVTNMVTNLMFEHNIDWDNTEPKEVAIVEEYINSELDVLIEKSIFHKGKVIFVSNELGMGLVPPYALGRYFRDIAGRANQKLAKNSDEAYFIVSGIPMKIK